jgi:hypothetical protein
MDWPQAVRELHRKTGKSIAVGSWELHTPRSENLN